MWGIVVYFKMLAVVFELAADGLRVSSRRALSLPLKTMKNYPDPKFSLPSPLSPPASPAHSSSLEGRPRTFVFGILWKTTMN